MGIRNIVGRAIGIGLGVAGLVLGSAAKADALDLYALGMNDDYDRLSLDLDSVELASNGDYIQFILVQQNSVGTTQNQGGIVGYTMLWATNCDTASMRSMVGYANGWRSVVHEDNNPTEWESPPSGSMLGLAVDIVCGQNSSPYSDIDSYRRFLSQFRPRIQY
jgi:hypothetical protein